MSNNNFELDINLDDFNTLLSITYKTKEEIEDLIKFCNAYYDWKTRNNGIQYDHMVMQNNLTKITPYLKIFIELYKNLKIANNYLKNTLNNQAYSLPKIENNLLNLNQEESEKLSNKLNNLNLIINVNTSSEVYDSIINYTYLALNLNLSIIKENKTLGEEIEKKKNKLN